MTFFLLWEKKKVFLFEVAAGREKEERRRRKISVPFRTFFGGERKVLPFPDEFFPQGNLGILNFARIKGKGEMPFNFYSYTSLFFRICHSQGVLLWSVSPVFAGFFSPAGGFAKYLMKFGISAHVGGINSYPTHLLHTLLRSGVSYGPKRGEGLVFFGGEGQNRTHMVFPFRLPENSAGGLSNNWGKWK